MRSDLKVSKQCRKLRNTANLVFCMIYRTVTCRSSDILLPLYKSLIRLHLEYCFQAWRPYEGQIYYRRFEKRATIMMVDLREDEYEEWLKKLGMI